MGLTLEWYYEKGHARVSIPGYITKMIHKFHEPKPIRTEKPPYYHTKTNYGAKVQLTVLEETAEHLAQKYVKHL